MRERKVHWPADRETTLCWRSLRVVLHTNRPEFVTCESCTFALAMKERIDNIKERVDRLVVDAK